MCLPGGVVTSQGRCCSFLLHIRGAASCNEARVHQEKELEIKAIIIFISAAPARKFLSVSNLSALIYLLICSLLFWTVATGLRGRRGLQPKQRKKNLKRCLWLRLLRVQSGRFLTPTFRFYPSCSAAE